MSQRPPFPPEPKTAAAFPLPANSVLDPGERLAIAYGLPSDLNAIRNWCIDTTLSDTTLQWICQEDIVPAGGMGLSYVGASGEEVALDIAAAPGNAFRLSFTDGAAAETADFQAGDPFGDVAVRKGKPFQQGLLAYRGFEGLRGEKRYELRAPLGNVTAVVSDGKLPVGYALSPGDVDYFVAEVVSARDCYPFGMGMPERSFDFGGLSVWV